MVISGVAGKTKVVNWQLPISLNIHPDCKGQSVGIGMALTRSQRGRSIFCSTWQALVVTELVPAHHRTEKSHGASTTYRLTEMLSRRYSLGKSGGHTH